MKTARFYTTADTDIFANVPLRMVTGETGLVYTVPARWGQAAVDMLLEQVFYPHVLPPCVRTVEEAGVPAWLWRSRADIATHPEAASDWQAVYETDIRAVLHRVAGGLTYKSWQAGLFEDEISARAFYDELRHMLVHQVATPELSIWSTTGLDWAYGLDGISLRFLHRVTLFDAESPQTMRRLRMLGDACALQNETAAVTLPVENAACDAFIRWKKDAELREAAQVPGIALLREAMHHVMDACDRNSFFGFDPARNAGLARAMFDARSRGVPDTAIDAAISYAAQGYESVPLDMTEEDAGPQHFVRTVISLPDTAVEAALTGHSFLAEEGSSHARHQDAAKMWDTLAESVWAAGEPALLFRSHARASAVDAGGAFLSSTEGVAPGGMLNLLAFMPAQKDTLLFDTAAFTHAAGIMTRALDAASPECETPAIALGLANLSAGLMAGGFAYDSDAGRAVAAYLAALLTGAATAAAAGLSRGLPASADRLQRIKETAAVVSKSGFSRADMSRKLGACPDTALATAAAKVWDDAYAMVRTHGIRHAHVTAMAADPAMQSLLGGQTAGIAPVQSLARVEGYFADGHGSAPVYGRTLNPMVPRALMRLGYSATMREDIHFYIVGHGTLFDAPQINHQALRAKGFLQSDIDAVEAALASVMHIRYAFNHWTLGDDFCRRVLGDHGRDGDFDLLAALGFNDDAVEEANLYCCGAMTLEGAPHVSPDHLPVFDCLFPPVPAAVRSVSPSAQIAMQAAVEAFLSGGAGQTVLLDRHATIDDVRSLMLRAWELGVKVLRLYREGCSWFSPVAPAAENLDTVAETTKEETPTCPAPSMTV